MSKGVWDKPYYVTVTFTRPESRVERRHRERMERLDKFLTGMFVVVAAGVLVLVTVALCHMI